MVIVIRIKVPKRVERAIVWLAEAYYRRRLGCDIRVITLSRFKFAIVDKDDFERLKPYRWFSLWNRCGYYAVRNVRRCERRRLQIMMHREIVGAPKGVLVDHINGNTLDNRKANLRLATASQNMYNTRRNKKGCASGFRGVSWHKHAKKWEARLASEGKRIYAGSYDSELEAAKAYDTAARKYHKEFARLNFPSES